MKKTFFLIIIQFLVIFNYCNAQTKIDYLLNEQKKTSSIFFQFWNNINSTRNQLNLIKNETSEEKKAKKVKKILEEFNEKNFFSNGESFYGIPQKKICYNDNYYSIISFYIASIQNDIELELLPLIIKKQLFKGTEYEYSNTIVQDLVKLFWICNDKSLFCRGVEKCIYELKNNNIKIDDNVNYTYLFNTEFNFKNSKLKGYNTFFPFNNNKLSYSDWEDTNFGDFSKAEISAFKKFYFQNNPLNIENQDELINFLKVLDISFDKKGYVRKILIPFRKYNTDDKLNCLASSPLFISTLFKYDNLTKFLVDELNYDINAVLFECVNFWTKDKLVFHDFTFNLNANTSHCSNYDIIDIGILSNNNFALDNYSNKVIKTHNEKENQNNIIAALEKVDDNNKLKLFLSKFKTSPETNNCKNNDFYIGETKNGLANGKGKSINKGVLYIGEFINGIYDGYGKLFNPKYEGNFKQGKFNGSGVLEMLTNFQLGGYANFKFNGNFTDNKKNGYFTITTDDSSEFKCSGNFINDLENGYWSFEYIDKSFGMRLKKTYTKYFENGIEIDLSVKNNNSENSSNTYKILNQTNADIYISKENNHFSIYSNDNEVSDKYYSIISTKDGYFKKEFTDSYKDNYIFREQYLEFPLTINISYLSKSGKEVSAKIITNECIKIEINPK
jgi:hypothetical protein